MPNSIAKIHAQATQDAKDMLTTISMTARVLADMMGDAHGGEWKANIDELGEFIVIRPVKPLAAAPKRGEVG